MKYTIGIDIGGTNTDAVLLKDEVIIASQKVPTSSDIASGVEEALKSVLKVAPDKIDSIIVGTTHATNAILQQNELYKVGVIRLAGQNPASPPPCFAWPEALRETVLAGHATISGGFECHGAPITPLDTEEVERELCRLIEEGAESIAVVGVFAPLNAEQELEVEKCIKARVPVTLSHQISGVGFIERENSTILNAALKKVMQKGFAHLQQICTKLELHCPLYVTQNNGSCITLEEAVVHPILTLSAGPTNSFVGAAKLAGLTDAIIVDIGGTSTDIGLIKEGHLRRSLNTSNIGGVKLNFSMPDVLSLAIGGGSLVDLHSSKVGPKSVGNEISKEAISFGGTQLTLTDLAVAIGQLSLEKKVPVPQEKAMELLAQVVQTIESNIAQLTAEKLPVLLVGGGAVLLPSTLLAAHYHLPPHAAVANAYGAALSGISGTVDAVVSLTTHETTLNALKEKAKQMARENGAIDASIRIADVQIIPYHYVPNNMARVIVSAHGKR